MRRALALTLAVALLPGCANYAVYGSTFGGSAAAATGTQVVVNGGLYASITLGATAANVLAGIGVATLFLAGNNISPIPPPTMREDREINEQDCTKPVVNLTANLKCR